MYEYPNTLKKDAMVKRMEEEWQSGDREKRHPGIGVGMTILAMSAFLKGSEPVSLVF